MSEEFAGRSEDFAKKSEEFARKSDEFAKRSDVFSQNIRSVCLTSYEVSTLIVRSKHVDRTK